VETWICGGEQAERWEIDEVLNKVGSWVEPLSISFLPGPRAPDSSHVP
jgi:hypothetical protein